MGVTPQVLIKGIILGYVEQARILGHGDLIWKDHWEKQPEYDYEPTIRMYGLRIVWIIYDNKLRSVVIALISIVKLPT